MGEQERRQDYGEDVVAVGTIIRLLAVLGMLVVTGCSAAGGSATEKNEPVTTVPMTSGSPLPSEQSAARIPDGTWSRVATIQQAHDCPHSHHVPFHNPGASFLLAQ